jgi:hypothetical protein
LCRDLPHRAAAPCLQRALKVENRDLLAPWILLVLEENRDTSLKIKTYLEV